MSNATIFVSGVHSGPSPSAGLGVARSLRAALPSLHLVGVDYWAGSSGLHHDVFDAIWLKPSWDLIEEDLYATEIDAELDAGACWIPTLDLEIAWLARQLGERSGLLAPPSAGLAQTMKPAPSIASALPLAQPPALDLAASDDEIHAFCRAHSFRVWVKGPYHDAVAVKSWRQLEATRAQLRKRWKTDRLSLQAHVRGYEESMVFAAADGTLLDALYMRKRIVTHEGKTWAGRIYEPPDELYAALEAAVAKTKWTGGAEIEVLRDVDGQLWLMEWNPRFPAWIHGATLAGRNLPAALICRALDIPAPTRRPLTGRAEFTRVVTEVAVRDELPLPLIAEPDHKIDAGYAKYGAELPSIVGKVTPIAGGPAAPRFTADLAADLAAAAADGRDTPNRILFRRCAEAAFAQVARHTGAGVKPTFAYSLKTCPSLEYLELARTAGMLAECISLLEVRRALEVGWSPAEIVLNGPGKWWPAGTACPDGLHAVFCDSIEELERLAASGRGDRVWGVRLRVPGLPSRFGVVLDEPSDFERLCGQVAALPAERAFGIHVHIASMVFGVGHWRDVVESAITWAASLEATTGKPVEVFDVGGGYHPDDLARIPFSDLADFIAARLPSLKEVLVEPGRALTQGTQGIVTSVLDVRRRDGKLDEVVVDTCIADLPLTPAYPHRVFRFDTRGPVPVARGPVRVLGRICMEDDVISTGLDLPEDLAVGDRFVVCDAGGYEKIMSYAFGRGGYL